MVAVGAGALAARAAADVLPVETRDDMALAVVWVAFAVPTVLALRRSRPRGLLRWRAVDLLYGLVFGLFVRWAQGSVAGLGGAPAAWPSTFSTGNGLPAGFLADAAAGSIVSPLVEELLFRGVVLVCVFAVLQPVGGRVAAGVASAALSTALFVVAHVLAGAPDAVDVTTMALLGLIASAFVLGTGRLGTAVVLHVVFNLSGYVLIAAGTLLA